MMQWPSLDTEIKRGNKQFSGPSRALRRSPVMVWTRQGPSAVRNTENTRVTNPKQHLDTGFVKVDEDNRSVLWL